MARRNTKRPLVKNSEIVNRARLAGLGGQHFKGERDLWQQFGYDQNLSLSDYRIKYERGDIAARIVEAYPEATWREPPKIKGVDLDQIPAKLKLWNVIRRLDILCQLGHYAVLLLGLDGGEQLSEPATQKNYKLLYLQPHGEQTAKITKWVDDPKDERFGKPEMYSITTGPDWGGAGGGNRTLEVHHSRVVHIADGALEHESIGQPRLRRGFNRLMDLEKLLGGSAEMYWQNVAMMLAFIADKEASFSPEDKAEMKDQLEEMQHGLRRMLRLRGMDVQNVAPGLQGAQPGEHVDAQLNMLAGAYAIPKRILVGNEAGELASSQDETSWQGRIAERRQQYATPVVLQPFIEKGLSQGWLNGTENPEIIWPESDTLGEKGRAEVAGLVAGACQQWANTMGDKPVTEDEFRELLGLDPMLESERDDELDEDDENVQQAFDESKRPNTLRPDENNDNTK